MPGCGVDELVPSSVAVAKDGDEWIGVAANEPRARLPPDIRFWGNVVNIIAKSWLGLTSRVLSLTTFSQHKSSKLCDGGCTLLQNNNVARPLPRENAAAPVVADGTLYRGQRPEPVNNSQRPRNAIGGV